MGGTFGKSGSWVVDHTMDDIPLTGFKDDSPRHGSIATVSLSSAGSQDDPITTTLYENPKEKRARRRSHWVAYTTMFVMSIGFSIVLSGVWPYLQKLNKDLEKDSLGLIVAANPLGQLIASPILGYAGNKMGSIRFACLSTVFFFMLGNIMYSLLYAFDGMTAYWAMFVSRFIVGVSSANVTLCRSYLAGSTTVKERTSGIAIIAAAQAMGFVVGPGIQTILTITIKGETDLTGGGWLIWDKFTAAGWVAALLGLINLIVLMPCIFQEHNIAEKERALLQQQQGGNKLDKLNLPKPDYIGVVGILFSFFITIFIYVLIETLAVPFAMDQYAWSEDRAMTIVGIALMGAGLLSSGIFPLSGVMGRRWDERKVMLLPGYIPLLIGSFLFIPYGGQDIRINPCNDTITTYAPSTTLGTTIVTPFSEEYSFLADEQLEEECVGCPQSQEWCDWVPQLPMAQLVVAFTIVMMGYPIVQSINMAIYSKMLGPKPQGLWMGVLTGVGSFGRIMGPIFVSLVYTNLGTIWCFSMIATGMVLAFIELLVMYPRLIPMKIPTAEEAHGYDGPGEKEKY